MFKLHPPSPLHSAIELILETHLCVLSLNIKSTRYIWIQSCAEEPVIYGIKALILYTSFPRLSFLLSREIRTAAVLRAGPSFSILALQGVSAAVLSDAPTPSRGNRAQSWKSPLHHWRRRDAFGPKHIRTSISQKTRSGTWRFGDGTHIGGFHIETRTCLWVTAEVEGKERGRKSVI